VRPHLGYSRPQPDKFHCESQGRFERHDVSLAYEYTYYIMEFGKDVSQ